VGESPAKHKQVFSKSFQLRWLAAKALSSEAKSWKNTCAQRLRGNLKDLRQKPNRLDCNTRLALGDWCFYPKPVFESLVLQQTVFLGYTS
jgi:hypothetical protein